MLIGGSVMCTPRRCPIVNFVRIRSSTTTRARPIKGSTICAAPRAYTPLSTNLLLFSTSYAVLGKGLVFIWLAMLRFHLVSRARSSIATAVAQEPLNGAPPLHSQTSPGILPIHSCPVLFALPLRGLATLALVINTLGYISESAPRSTRSPCN